MILTKSEGNEVAHRKSLETSTLFALLVHILFCNTKTLLWFWKEFQQTETEEFSLEMEIVTFETTTSVV